MTEESICMQMLFREPAWRGVRKYLPAFLLLLTCAHGCIFIFDEYYKNSIHEGLSDITSTKRHLLKEHLDSENNK
jgi:hypothetical protein